MWLGWRGRGFSCGCGRNLRSILVRAATAGERWRLWRGWRAGLVRRRRSRRVRLARRLRRTGRTAMRQPFRTPVSARRSAARLPRRAATAGRPLRRSLALDPDAVNRGNLDLAACLLGRHNARNRVGIRALVRLRCRMLFGRIDRGLHPFQHRVGQHRASGRTGSRSGCSRNAPLQRQALIFHARRTPPQGYARAGCAPPKRKRSTRSRGIQAESPNVIRQVRKFLPKRSGLRNSSDSAQPGAR